jgi:D-beta-D-heptose 7-phosphate kinase / D-beta-D-heptose 1-phosphate adenosyltransferase
MDVQKINDLLLEIKQVKPKILVVGDAMLDHYIYGSVNRISPEAPVPILKHEKERSVLGGAGNVLINLLNLGVETDIATLIGEDSEGKYLHSLFPKKTNKLVFFSKNINTTKKTRFLSGSSQLLRLDKDSEGYKVEDFKKIKRKITVSIKKYNGIIISDYDKGLCTEDLITSLITEANRVGVPIFIDPKGQNWAKYSFSTCLTPNINEVENELNQKIKSDIEFENAAKIIQKKYKLKSCLITRGAEGMTYYSENHKTHQRVGKKEVFDVSGAGDSVISCFVAGLCSGISLKESLSLSAFISSEVVSHIGTTPFNIKMLSADE